MPVVPASFAPTRAPRPESRSPSHPPISPQSSPPSCRDTASIANPIDMIATASAEHYRKTLATVAGSGEFDAILAIFVPPLVTEATDVAAAINEVAAATDGCPIAAVFMTAEGPPPELAAGEDHRARLSVSRGGSAGDRSRRAVREVEIAARGA